METENSAFEFRKIIAFDENWTGRKGFVTDHMEDIDLSEYKGLHVRTATYGQRIHQKTGSPGGSF